MCFKGGVSPEPRISHRDRTWGRGEGGRREEGVLMHISLTSTYSLLLCWEVK